MVSKRTTRCAPASFAACGARAAGPVVPPPSRTSGEPVPSTCASIAVLATGCDFTDDAGVDNLATTIPSAEVGTQAKRERPAARQRQRPDAEIACGGEVSWRFLQKC